MLAQAVNGVSDVVLASRLDCSHIPPVLHLPRLRCASGYCHVAADSDGVVRQFSIAPDGVEATCFPLALLRLAFHSPQFVPQGYLDAPGTRFPITWAGAPGQTFPEISLARVLSGKGLAKEVKGRVVLLGSTLAGSAGRVRTPISTTVWGRSTGTGMTRVELMANIVYTLASQDSLQRLTAPQTALFVGGIAFVTFVIAASFHPLFSAVVCLFLIAMTFLETFGQMVLGGHLYPLFAPCFAVVAAWGAAGAWRFGAWVWKLATRGFRRR